MGPSGARGGRRRFDARVGDLGGRVFSNSRVESHADVLTPDRSLFVYTLMVPVAAWHQRAVRRKM